MIGDRLAAVVLAFEALIFVTQPESWPVFMAWARSQGLPDGLSLDGAEDLLMEMSQLITDLEAMGVGAR